MKKTVQEQRARQRIGLVWFGLVWENISIGEGGFAGRTQ